MELSFQNRSFTLLWRKASILEMEFNNGKDETEHGSGFSQSVGGNELGEADWLPLTHRAATQPSQADIMTAKQRA